MDTVVALAAATLNAGTPLLLAAIGVLVCERSGVVNLGVEGVMLVAAVAGFAAVHATGNYGWGFASGAMAGVAFAGPLRVVRSRLQRKPVCERAGARLVRRRTIGVRRPPFAGLSLPPRGADALPVLGDLPLLAPTVPAACARLPFVAARRPVTAWFLFRTRAGLVLRGIGEAPAAAFALGYRVRTWRVARRAVRRHDRRTGRRVPGDDLHAVVVRRHGRRAWMDRACAGGLRDLASGPRRGRRLPVWRRHDVATVPAGAWAGDDS